MESNPPRIFISYSRRDGRPLGECLESLLRAQNITSWRDKQSMGAGDILPQVLRAIEESDHLVLILSQAALASTWVNREWTHARLHGKRVSPILADKSLVRADLPSWLRRQQIFDLDDQEESELLIATLRDPSPTRRVPYMEGHLTEDFVPRPQEYALLKQAVLAAGQSTVGLTTALRGAGGYGKTSLANALCRDPDIRAEFFDGILRVEIGKERNDVIGTVLELCQILRPGNHPGFQTDDSAADYLASLIGEARILLVIDDVWRAAQLRPFLRPRPNCARLITTRKPEILPRDCTSVKIDEMRAGESVAVLAARLPGATAPAARAKLAALAKRLGNWVQMLRLANGWLRKRTESGEPLLQAIELFEARLTKKGLTAFDPKNQKERDQAIGACFDASLEELGADLARLEELAILPEDQDVPLDIIADLWRETAALDADEAEDLFTCFDGQSLLQSLDLETRTLSLHDNMLWYLRGRGGEEACRAAHAAMVRSLAKKCGGDWPNLPVDQKYGWQSLIRHLRAAGQHEDADERLTDYTWLKVKMATSGPQSLFGCYQPQPNSEAARLVGRSIALSLPTLAADNRELARQLYGRLGNSKIEKIRSLVEAACGDSCFQPKPRWPAQSPPGPEILRIGGHDAMVNSVGTSSDFTYILTASADKTARLWSVALGTQIAIFKGHERGVNKACLSRDGCRLATASSDKTARLWELATRQETGALRGHGRGVNGVAFAYDGRWIVTASTDRTARLWDVDGLREIAAFRGHEALLCSAEFSPDDSRIVTASADSTARIWISATGVEVAILRGHEKGLNSASFSNDGSLIVTSSSDKTARLWDSSTGAEIGALVGHESGVKSAKFSPDSTVVVTASGDSTARLWNVATRRQLAILRGHERGVNSAEFSPDGRYIITASTDRTTRLWDVSAAQEVAGDDQTFERSISSINFAFDGDRVVTTSQHSTAWIWDALMGQKLAALQGHEDTVKAAAFSPNGRMIVTASADRTARVWDSATAREMGNFSGHMGDVNTSNFSPDNLKIITASDDGTVRLWDVRTGQEVRIIQGHDGPLRSAQFSADGCRIVTASDDGTARVWDVAHGKEVAALSGHELGLTSATFSPDGCFILTASEDTTARLWNAANGREIVVFRGHRGRLRGARFLANGTRIATASHGNTARIWAVATGQELTRITLETSVTAIDTHGSAFALGDPLGRIHIYDADAFNPAGVTHSA